jgi:hypothetical protein
MSHFIMALPVERDALHEEQVWAAECDIGVVLAGDV